MDRVFVYGTLRRGGSASRLLEGRCRFVGPGTVRGTLFDAGEFPALVREGGGKVIGEVYDLTSADALPDLDTYEEAIGARPLFRRESVWVSLADGSRLKAWAYVYNRATSRLSPIPSGDYPARRRARS